MSFVQFYRILWARRWIIIAATLACFAAALIASRILPVRYQATSRVMIDLIKPDPVTGQTVSGAYAKSYTRTQAELIRDYRTTGAVVDSLGWTSAPNLLASYNAAGQPMNGDFRRWLAQQVSDNTSVRLSEGSNILEITYTASNPDNARVVADAVRAAYLDQNLAFKREAASKTADWYDTQVAKLRNDVARADARKTDFEKANNLVLQDDSTDSETNRLKALSGQVPLSLPQITGGGGISPTALQLAAVESRIQSESQSLGPNHPTIQELQRQRALLASAVARERSGGAVVASGPSLSGQVKAQEERVLAQRGKLDEARRLQTDVAVLRDQYAKAVARAADLRQQSQSDEAGLTLLGSAIEPTSPSFPNMPLILGGSIVAGLVLGILSALITELLSRRVRGIEDLAYTGVPVIIVLGGYAAPRLARPSLRQRLLPAPAQA